MPYSKQHKKNTRQKILDSAFTLFSTYGFDKVSIDDLMDEAGLTRGAFYSHFESKQALYAKAIVAGTRKSAAMQKKPDDVNQIEWMKTLLKNYLSQAHIDQTFSPCPLAFLVTDIAHRDAEVKETYAKIYKGLNASISDQLESISIHKKEAKPNEEAILAATAMMIGGVAIGRTLNDSAQKERLLKSCRQEVFALLQLTED